jgi:thiamine biosynthesis lipoprotein
MHYDEFRAMNSDILLAASGTDAAVIKEGFAMARQYINQSEQRFTRFSETSELAELNRNSGCWFQVSAEMFEVIRKSYDLAVETDGLFNPAVLPALKRAGYDRSMDEIRSGAIVYSSIHEEAEQQLDILDFRQVRLDQDTRSIYMPQGMQVDLGGIAKGWIAEQAARKLAEIAHSCAVSAGGDIYLVNLPEGKLDWEVGLEDPLKPDKNLAILHVKPGAVATSSTVKRQWRHNGQVKHHLIDPRTGDPAETDWISVTVWAEEAADAEVYAKALLIGGSKNAENLFLNQTTKAFLAVDKTGWVLGSKNYHEVFNV